ncbi:MAG: hypothetical protein JSW39_29685 [Desulfobacterales bacterium]|nr:MAG: hypothetical protein JSW39_29685 [Desulfobacterales bacterium]
MAESVRALPDDIQKLIEVREWDMRTHPGIKRFRELRAKSLPSIAMDEELVYEAIIPGQEKLSAEIQRRYRKKNGR